MLASYAFSIFGHLDGSETYDPRAIRVLVIALPVSLQMRQLSPSVVLCINILELLKRVLLRNVVGPLSCPYHLPGFPDYSSKVVDDDCQR